MCVGAHPFAPTPNTFQCAVRYAVTEGKAENVLYFQAAGPPGLSDYQIVKTAIDDWWENTYKALISGAVQHTSCYFRDVSQSLQPSIELPRVPTAGGVLGDPLPFKDSFAIKKVSTLGGRRRDGRLYVFGITEGQVTRNSVLTAVAAQWRDAWDVLRADLDALGYPMGWVSYCLNGVWRTTGLFVPITEFVVTDDLVDSMNRRKPNVGS